MKKLCIQSADIPHFFGKQKAYQMIADAGFDAVDWNLDHAWTVAEGKAVEEYGEVKSCILDKPLDEVLAFYAEEIAAIKAAGLKVAQAHSVFPSYRSYLASTYVDYAIECHKKLMYVCREVGCPYLVVHGINYDLDFDADDREKIDRLNMHMYESLIPTALETGVTVCLENIFFNSKGRIVSGMCGEAAEAVEWVDKLNRKAGAECFGFCLDTGHLFLLRRDISVFIETLSHRIKCVHIHDNDGSDDAHMAPYTGNIPWFEFYTAMNRIGYNGYLSFETFMHFRKVEKALVPEILRHVAKIGEFFAQEIYVDEK